MAERSAAVRPPHPAAGGGRRASDAGFGGRTGRRKEGGGRRQPRDGGVVRLEPDAGLHAAAIVESARSWVEGVGSGEDALQAMAVLSRAGRREIQGDTVAAVKSMIEQGCKAIAAPASSTRKPAEVLLFLRTVQRMLYQEALKMEDSARREIVQLLLGLTALKSAEARVRERPENAECNAEELEQLKLLMELARTVGCLLYESPSVSEELLPTIVDAIQPLLEFPRDMPSSSSAVVAATLLHQEQQQTQRRDERQTRVLLSACSADVMANATAGLGRAVEPLAADVLPQLILNLNAWSSLVIASLSLEGLAKHNGAGVDVYMEALAGTLRALHIILGEVGVSSSSATSVAQMLSERTLAELRGARLLPSLAESLVSIALWMPSKSAVVAAQAVGIFESTAGSDHSDMSELESSDARSARRQHGHGRGERSRQGEEYSSADGFSTDDVSAGAKWRGRAAGGMGAGFGGSLAKIRLHAVMSIQGVARLQPKVFHPFWAQLLPGDAIASRRGGERHTLLDLLVSDPSPKVRAAVAMTLAALLQRSRTYMAAAEERRVTVSSYMSFSQSLAMRISATHTALCNAARHETHASTALHVIKALAALLAHAPYRRLRRGLLGESVAAMRSVLGNNVGEKRDVQLRTAALSCLAALLENPLTLADLAGDTSVLLTPLMKRHPVGPVMGAGRATSAGDGAGGEAHGSGYGKWGPAKDDKKPENDSGASSAALGAARGGSASTGSLDVLLGDLILVAEGSDGDANPVRVEALRAISGIVRNDCPSVCAIWDRLGPLLKHLLQTGAPPLRTHSAKVAECLVGAAEDREEDDEEGDGNGGGEGGSASNTPVRGLKSRTKNTDASGGDGAATASMFFGRIIAGGNEGVLRASDLADRLPEALWAELVHDLLPVMLADDCQSVRASAMSAIAFVPSNHQRFSSFLDAVWASACPGDNKSSAARGAALKTLGILTHVEPYCNDVQFLIKVSDALDRCSRDAFIAVRLKVFLALAYLCERSFVIPKHATSDYLRHHAGLTLARLCDMALRSINDHDKVRVYGARALGYLASAPEFVTLVQQSTSTAAAWQLCSRIEGELSRIISSADYSVKVRWNACHAAKLILALSPPRMTAEAADAQSPAANGATRGVWGPKLIGALRSAGTNAHNFKVRIQATRALREMRTLELFERRHAAVDLWRWAVTAVQQHVVLSDPSQYKYKQTLVQEQRVCVVALTALVGQTAVLSNEAEAEQGEGGDEVGRAPKDSISWAEARTVLGCILQELRTTTTSSLPATSPSRDSVDSGSLCCVAAAAAVAMLSCKDCCGTTEGTEAAYARAASGNSDKIAGGKVEGVWEEVMEHQRAAAHAPESRLVGEERKVGPCFGASLVGEERALGLRGTSGAFADDGNLDDQTVLRMLSALAAARTQSADGEGATTCTDAHAALQNAPVAAVGREGAVLVDKRSIGQSRALGYLGSETGEMLLQRLQEAMGLDDADLEKVERRLLTVAEP